MITANGKPKFDSIQLGMFKIDRSQGMTDLIEAEFHYIGSKDHKVYGSVKVVGSDAMTEEVKKKMLDLIEQLEKVAVAVIYGETQQEDKKEEDDGGEPQGLADESEEPDQI